jgi:glycosyltransferase involved in cell wall biosynthesis
MSVKPLVDVLISTHNRCHLLEKAVRSALAQSYDNLVVIVSDNASTDETPHVMHDIVSSDTRVRYIRSAQNLRPIKNYRRCFDAATGSFCLTLNDDDLLLDRDFIANGVSLLRKYNAGLLVPDCIIGRWDSRKHVSNLLLPERIDGREFFFRFWDGSYQIPVISCIFDRTLAQRCKPYADDTILFSDLELWLKMMLLTDVVYYSFPSVYYHLHDSNAVFALSLDDHRANIHFIDRVYEFATTKSLQKPELSAWRSRMYRHYIFRWVLNGCVQRGIPAKEFATFGAECGESIGLSYTECLLKYRHKTSRKWRLTWQVITRVLGRRASKALLSSLIGNGSTVPQ